MRLLLVPGDRTRDLTAERVATQLEVHVSHGSGNRALAVAAVTGMLLAAAVTVTSAPAYATAPPTASSTAKVPAATPPMGFNDWNAFGCGVDEALIKQTADIFVSAGLKAAG